MNNRVTLQDIAKTVAEKTGKKNKDIDLFLRNLVTILTDDIAAAGAIEIKGLGTFKLTPIEERESINVNTGERFVIPAHNRYSFVPDKELKELINKPFSFFDTVELNENITAEELESVEAPEEEEEYEEVAEKGEEAPVLPNDPPESSTEAKEEEPENVEHTPTNIEEALKEAKESMDQLSAPAAATTAEETPVSEALPEEEAEEPADELPIAASEEPVADLTPEEITEEAEAEQSEEPEEATPPPPPIKDEGEEDEEEYEDENYSYRGEQVKKVLIFLAVIVVIGGGFFLYQHFKKPPQTVAESSPLDMPKPQAVVPDSTKTAVNSTAEAVVDSVVPPPAIEEKPPRRDTVKPAAKQPEKPKEAPARKVIARVKVQKGDRLTVIAQKHYGNKIFWVYIYEYNKSKIKNPDLIPLGTELEIPAPEIYQIDPKNKESVSKAAELQSKILVK